MTRSTLALKLSVSPPFYPWVTATAIKEAFGTKEAFMQFLIRKILESLLFLRKKNLATSIHTHGQYHLWVQLKKDRIYNPSYNYRTPSNKDQTEVQ